LAQKAGHATVGGACCLTAKKRETRKGGSSFGLSSPPLSGVVHGLFLSPAAPRPSTCASALLIGCAGRAARCRARRARADPRRGHRPRPVNTRSTACSGRRASTSRSTRSNAKRRHQRPALQYGSRTAERYRRPDHKQSPASSFARRALRGRDRLSFQRCVEAASPTLPGPPACAVVQQLAPGSPRRGISSGATRFKPEGRDCRCSRISCRRPRPEEGGGAVHQQRLGTTRKD